MSRYLFYVIVVFGSTFSFSQELSGDQLLKKAIEYHDPNGNWPSFKGQLYITMTTPDQKERISQIKLDFPNQFFELSATTDGHTVNQRLSQGECALSLNGSTEIAESDIKTHRLTCERANMMKDYYTYLYGLPMKLRDPGTKIDSRVQNKKFNDKEYLVLKATYDQAVGEDIWYFYFVTNTYAMEVYQFFHDESKNDGEYIILDGIETLNGIKMPKTRSWYYNKDDKFLGVDVLTKVTPL